MSSAWRHTKSDVTTVAGDKTRSLCLSSVVLRRARDTSTVLLPVRLSARGPVLRAVGRALTSGPAPVNENAMLS